MKMYFCLFYQIDDKFDHNVENYFSNWNKYIFARIKDMIGCPEMSCKMFSNSTFTPRCINRRINKNK